MGRLNFDFHTDGRRGPARSWSGRPAPAAATRACPLPAARRRTSFVVLVRARRASSVAARARSAQAVRALIEPWLQSLLCPRRLRGAARVCAARAWHLLCASELRPLSPRKELCAVARALQRSPCEPPDRQLSCRIVHCSSEMCLCSKLELRLGGGASHGTKKRGSRRRRLLWTKHEYRKLEHTDSRVLFSNKKCLCSSSAVVYLPAAHSLPQRARRHSA